MLPPVAKHIKDCGACRKIIARKAHPVSLLHGIMMILCKDWTGLPYLPLH